MNKSFLNMEKTLAAFLTVLILAAGFLTACESTPSPTPTPQTPTPVPATPTPPPGGNTVIAFLGKDFSLAIGQSASFSDAKLSVKFLDVTEDSRCPTGVVCVWAGQVSCALEVNDDGNIEQVKLTVLGGSTTTSQTVGGYSFAFKVDPYPEAGKQIVKEDYRLNLTITRQAESW